MPGHTAPLTSFTLAVLMSSDRNLVTEALASRWSRLQAAMAQHSTGFITGHCSSATGVRWVNLATERSPWYVAMAVIDRIKNYTSVVLIIFTCTFNPHVCVLFSFHYLRWYFKLVLIYDLLTLIQPACHPHNDKQTTGMINLTVVRSIKKTPIVARKENIVSDSAIYRHIDDLCIT